MECYIVPRVTPYLKHQIIQLKDRCVFLSALKEPVPRGVMDYILKQPNISEMFERCVRVYSSVCVHLLLCMSVCKLLIVLPHSLTDRQMTRNLTRRGEHPVYNRIEGHLIPVSYHGSCSFTSSIFMNCVSFIFRCSGSCSLLV